jgi:hypothetical protein
LPEKDLTMDNKIREAQKHLFRYDYLDGTPDLAIGRLCLVMAICFFIFAAFPVLSSSTFSASLACAAIGGGGLVIG